MPPEISSCCSLVIPLVQLFPPPSPRSVHSSHLNHKYCRGAMRMKFTKKNLIPLLILILTSISILRLLKLTISTSSYALLQPRVVSQKCHSPVLPCNGTLPELHSTNLHTPFTTANNLSYKEFKFLSNLISHKAPCNLLIFGLQPQYLELASLNAGGYTIILEDDPRKLREITVSSKTTRIHKVEYHIPAGDAYKLLKYARLNPVCTTRSGVLQLSSCQLALTKLPQEVYTNKWDIVVVDGPNGDRADTPGRMGTIYSASILARSTNMTEVVVHDVDRMIEKWFSWEFLSDDNLVSSKGRFWHFRIMKQQKITRS